MNLFNRIMLLTFSIGIILGILVTSQFVGSAEAEMPFTENSKELMSPYDHIKQDQIHVYDNRVVLDIKAEWAMIEDTNSMDPLFDKEANVLQVVPKSEEDIHLGDIISYQTDKGVIIHRVVGIDKDEKGTYFTVKGDNNKDPDPEKVRFDMVRRVLIGILY